MVKWRIIFVRDTFIPGSHWCALEPGGFTYGYFESVSAAMRSIELYLLDQREWEKLTRGSGV